MEGSLGLAEMFWVVRLPEPREVWGLRHEALGLRFVVNKQKAERFVVCSAAGIWI